MDAELLEVGVTYFRIAYADVAQTMPSIEPLVYAGTNIFRSAPDGSARYYFQDAVSVVKYGLGAHLRHERQPAGETAHSDSDDHGECVYSVHEESEIGVAIVDLPALAGEIELAVKRAVALGFPRLTKAGGKWV